MGIDLGKVLFDEEVEGGVEDLFLMGVGREVLVWRYGCRV